MYALNDPLSVKALSFVSFVSRLPLWRSLALLMGLVIWFVSPAPAYALDDRQITVRTATDVSNKRQALIDFIWGSDGFPSNNSPSVTKNVCSLPQANNPPADDVCGGFVSNLSNLKRVDEIRVHMEAGEEGLAYHFIPVRKNNKLVIIHSGHNCYLKDDHGFGCTLNDPADHEVAKVYCEHGLQRAINALLDDGYSVLAMYMPHFRPDDCEQDDHNFMFDIPVTTGSPMKFFLEPVAVCLNYLKTKYSTDNFPKYEEFDMAGISGGGWTATVYAAIDPTIKFSFPVAGTVPLYTPGSGGDLEQTLDAFYRIAGYPDLYVMGSYGFGRKQVQVLNRHDSCCFGEAGWSSGTAYVQAMRSYETRVRQVMSTLGDGTFRLEIDEAAPVHMISLNTVVNVILSELNNGRRYIGASASTDAFVRGMNGHLWHHSSGGWKDTRFAMVGVPAVLQGIGNGFDVFFRDPGNHLKHAYWNTGSGWAIQGMPGQVLPAEITITDPVATSWGAGRFDVVALGANYKLYHWWWSPGNPIKREQVSNTALGIGPAALVSWGINRLDIFFRGWDRAVYHMRSSGSVPWTLDSPGGVILDFPSAVTTGGNTLRAYVRGQNSQLFQAWQTNGGAWHWNSLSAVTRSAGTPLSGSPSATVQAGRVKVYMRTSTGNLSSFTLSGTAWSFLNHTGLITGSPTSTPGGAFVRGSGAGLWLFDGSNWTNLGGLFD